MLRVLVLAVTLTVILADDKEKCRKAFHPKTMRCCKNEMLMPSKINKEEIEECFNTPRNHKSCEQDICIGKKRGFASDDGSVDMDAWEKITTEDFKNAPAVVEALKKNCIKGDLSKYGPPDACKLMKLKMCMHTSMINECKEWDNEGTCAGVEDLVQECAKTNDKEKCRKAFHPKTMRCCKNEMLMPSKINKEEIEECFNIPRNHKSCEKDICIGKKRGFASDDGSVDMDAWEKITTEDFKNAPAVVEAIKKNCIKGDLSKYGPPDGCKLMKLKICMHTSMINECKEWDNEGTCAGVEDLVQECAKVDK